MMTSISLAKTNIKVNMTMPWTDYLAKIDARIKELQEQQSNIGFDFNRSFLITRLNSMRRDIETKLRGYY